MPGGQWRGSARRERLPADWPEICATVAEAYGTDCHMCGHPGASDTDHLQRGDDHRIENLRRACGRNCPHCKAEHRTPCHPAKSSREGGQAAQAARPKRTRPAEQHPGMRRQP